MTPTTSPPVFSLQAPKDISIDDIEAELRDIWRNYADSDGGTPATRATTFSFLVYEPEATQQLLAALGFYNGPIDGIAGPRMVAAIKAAQKTYNLEVTGTSNQQLSTRLREEFDRAKLEGNLSEAKKNATLHALPDLEGAAIADAIAASNPCRIITLCPTAEEDEGVTVQVSAYCPIQKRGQSALICCEYITLRGTAGALERIGGVISELMISELPKFVWWKASPQPNYGLFKRLVTLSDTMIVDSSTFSDPEADLRQVSELLKQNITIADLNWGRLAAWQELVAEAFDPPERRAAIWEIDRVTIDYEKGNPTQALMYLSWLASRLNWRIVSYQHQGGDYDIRRIYFTTDNQRQIEAELAGVPVAEWGEVLGDLMSLKLSSTNLEADCCTVLCSETAGCMRMEAGGGAQACRIDQVTSLSDQNTEQLLGRQLQRWGRDQLFEESMKITGEILKLAKTEG